MTNPVTAKDACAEMWGILCPDAGPEDYTALVEEARRLVQRAQRRHCCFINNETQESCDKEAWWEIWSGEGPDDFTDACTLHVGAMLTDAKEHRVYFVGDHVEAVGA